MKAVSHGDSLHEFWISSESDSEKEYLVRLGQYPLGLNDNGSMKFNGACICTKTPEIWHEFGCEDWRYRCEPRLKDPKNIGKSFRCKHVKYCIEVAFETILPHLVATDKNIPDEHQT